MLLNEGYESVVPVTTEYNAVWRRHHGDRVDAGDVSKNLKEPLYISQKGVALVCLSELLREGKLYSKDKCGFVELDKNFNLVKL